MDLMFRDEPLSAWLNEVAPTALLLNADHETPNNAVLPVLLYPSVVRLPSTEPAELFEVLFSCNEWPAAWRNGVFDYHHFHTTAHEALGVYSGEVTVQLGGSEGVSVDVHAGDVAIIPAGVAHRNLGSSTDLGIVGAYPAGQSPDEGRPDASRLTEFINAVSKVAPPEQDPVFGAEGFLLHHW